MLKCTEISDLLSQRLNRRSRHGGLAVIFLFIFKDSMLSYSSMHAKNTPRPSKEQRLAQSHGPPTKSRVGGESQFHTPSARVLNRSVSPGRGRSTSSDIKRIAAVSASKGALARSNAKLAIASLRDSSDDDSIDLLRAEALLNSSRQR